MMDRESRDHQSKSPFLIEAPVEFSVPFPALTALQSVFLKLYFQYQFLNITYREHTVVHRYDYMTDHHRNGHIDCQKLKHREGNWLQSIMMEIPMYTKQYVHSIQPLHV